MPWRGPAPLAGALERLWVLPPGRERLAMVAEFEPDLIRIRTREGMKITNVKDRLRRKQGKPICGRRTWSPCTRPVS